MSLKRKRKKQVDLGGLSKSKFQNSEGDYCKAKKIISRNQLDNNQSVLFSRGKKTKVFYTEESRLYITPRESRLIEKGFKIRRLSRLDSVGHSVLADYSKYKIGSGQDALYQALKNRLDLLREMVEEKSASVISSASIVRAWNASIVGALVLGMLSMTFMYRYFGQSASAEESDTEKVAIEQQVEVEPGQIIEEVSEQPEQKLEITKEEKNEVQNLMQDVIVTSNDEQKINKEDPEVIDQKVFEQKVREMVKGHPIEEMLPYIFTKDRLVAAYLIGIAKQESNWGERVPVLNGSDCYNYWGFRAQRKLMGSNGHTCFNSRKDAVDTVARRINELVYEYDRKTAEKMVVWKCGYSCTGHSSAGVKRWISVVDKYVSKLIK